MPPKHSCLITGLLAFRLMAVDVPQASTSINGHSFSLPRGFSLQLAADASLAPRPVSASVDGRGRLFVTDSSGTAESPSEQIKHPSHRILRLEDTNHDGRYDKVVVFAEHVMFPQGCLAYGRSVYVAAPPSIWRYTDKDGDGVADEAVEWWKGGTLTGCANDLHGPCLGPDGYIYWTKGAFAEQTHERPGRPTIHDKAAHIYRAKPDGSELELVMSGGMDNPVEVAFNKDGEAFFTSTFIDFTQPGRRDGIAHAVYGGVFGKVNQVLEDGLVQRSSPDLLPVMTQFGPGAACGLCSYGSRTFGPEYEGNLFATTFNLHKVSRHVLRPAGASYQTEDHDFLTSPDVDFHPTDVLEDGDGSLLVVDTGGWYKLCCPSSQLAKPDVLGAIYRITRDGMPVVRRATGQPPGHEDGPLWKMKQAGLHRDATAIPALRKVMESFVAEPKPDLLSAVRVAAEAAGRIGDATMVPLLLQAAALADDPFLFHSITFALIEIHSPDTTADGLKSISPSTRRSALMALDQMAGASLEPDQVTAHLSSTNAPLREAARWILSHHTPWAPQLVDWFQARLSGTDLSPGTRSTLESELPLFNRLEVGQKFLGRAAGDASLPSSTRSAALSAIGASSEGHPPAEWTSAVVGILNSREAALIEAALPAAERLAKEQSVAPALHRIAESPDLPNPLKLRALRSLPTASELTPAEVRFLQNRLEPANPAVDRTLAAEILGRSQLSPTELSGLLEAIQTAAPIELSKLLVAYDAGGDETLGRKFLAAIRESKAAQALPFAQLKSHFARFPESVRAEAEPFFDSLHQDAARQAKELDTLLARLQSLPADILRGQSLFNGPKAACSTCHKIGYLGGEVGPELTKIGEVRTERDLLESIVYPSASFVRSYEPTALTLKDGEVVSGIVHQETPEEVEVVTGPGPTRRLARADITGINPGTVSVMPAGLGDALSHQELADILKFVKTVRWR